MFRNCCQNEKNGGWNNQSRCNCNQGGGQGGFPGGCQGRTTTERVGPTICKCNYCQWYRTCHYYPKYFTKSFCKEENDCNCKQDNYYNEKDDYDMWDKSNNSYSCGEFDDSKWNKSDCYEDKEKW